jgi:hypothetical protein
MKEAKKFDLDQKYTVEEYLQISRGLLEQYGNNLGIRQTLESQIKWAEPLDQNAVLISFKEENGVCYPIVKQGLIMGVT